MDIKETRDGMDSFRSGQGPVVGSCEHSNEPLGSTNDRDLLDQLSDNQPLSSQTIISWRLRWVAVWFIHNFITDRVVDSLLNAANNTKNKNNNIWQ